MLQAPELPQGIQADGEIDYIIPNVAFLEMCKHDAFLSTMRQALQVFGDHADRVHVTRSVGMCLGDEMRALRLTDGGNMLSDEQSEYGRRLIRDLLSGNMDSAAEIQRELDQARTVVLSADLNADDAKERAQRYLSLIERGCTPTCKRRCALGVSAMRCSLHSHGLSPACIPGNGCARKGVCQRLAPGGSSGKSRWSCAISFWWCVTRCWVFRAAATSAR